MSTGLAPQAVFSHPQIAGVGLTEAQAIEQGIDHVVAVHPYSDTAHGWALEDTQSFVKVVADPTTRAASRLLGPTVDQLGREVLYIHPALTEVLVRALLEL